MRLALIYIVILGLFLGAQEAIAEEYRVEVKVCKNYISGQFLDCNEIGDLTAGFSAFQMHAVIEITWVSADISQRPNTELYLMWEYHRDGTVKVLSNPSVRADYKFSPRRLNNPTRWRVTQTAWFNQPGTYFFYVYTDPSDPKNSIKADASVTVREPGA